MHHFLAALGILTQENTPSNFRIQTSSLGLTLTLEFKNKVQGGLFWTLSLLDVDPNVNPQLGRCTQNQHAILTAACTHVIHLESPKCMIRSIRLASCSTSLLALGIRYVDLVLIYQS